MSDQTTSQPNPSEDLQRILDSARRLGVEMNEAEALQWLTAIGVTGDSDITIDAESGVFGHRITMLDFSPSELAHFRRIGKIVEFDDQPGRVETALALSGSAAQSKIQSFPGDADFFERVNIIAATKEDACRILAEIMRSKALDKLRGDAYQLLEVKFGAYPQDMVKDGRPVKAGSPIAWLPDEIAEGEISGFTTEGSPLTVTWEQVSSNPGWCKLDWVVADAAHKQLTNASNMLDVTWERPDGEIVPLDGYLDPYFQEVYLDAESIPVFTKLAKHVSSDALDRYVQQLEHEVKKYLTKDINYGKVAKRMYNIFRLTGHYEEAAFLRELFDEPATLLYQVWSLIRTIDDCFHPNSAISITNLLSQTDALILDVVRLTEGEQETEIVRLLLRLRDILSREAVGEALSPQAEAARAEVINLVNNFFYEKLSAVPGIKDYMEAMASS
jgi:hypothetical protein